MKVTFTFEYKDLLEQIEKMLSMNGVRALVDKDGNKEIHFDSKKKEVVIHCEAAPLPKTCLFCGSDVQKEAQTQPCGGSDDSKTNEVSQDEVNDGDSNDDVSQVNKGDSEENMPMSLASLRARSDALASRKSPFKVARGAEAHAALAKPSLMDGESEDPPFPGEGGM